MYGVVAHAVWMRRTLDWGPFVGLLSWSQRGSGQRLCHTLGYRQSGAGNAGPLGHSLSGWVWRNGAGPGAGLCRMCQALGWHCVGSSWGPSHFSLLLPQWLLQILPPPQTQTVSCSPQAPEEVRSALALALPFPLELGPTVPVHKLN